jgi:hypothetical protein
MRFVILRQGGTALATPPAAGITLHEDVQLGPRAAAVAIGFTAHGPGPLRPPGAGPQGLSVIEAPSREAALAWLRAQPVHEGEFELRDAGCAGGLPGVDPTAGSTMPRFVVFVKADADTEAETTPPAPRLEAMARRNDEAVQSGMLLAADGLRGTAKGTRVTFRDGRHTVVDGPFAEAKELIAGYWLIQAPSLDDAIAWVRRYPYAQQRPEVEIHPVLP